MNIRQIKPICFIFVFCISFSYSFCQQTQSPSGLFVGTRCDGITINQWSQQINPALLPFDEHSEVGVLYNTNFRGANMVCTRVNARTRMKQYAVATSIAVFGNQYYRETDYYFSVARCLNAQNALAITFDVVNQYQMETGRSVAVLPEISFMHKEERLSCGVDFENPVQIFRKNAKYSSTCKLLCNYAVIPSFILGLEVYRTNASDFVTVFAANYIWNERVRCYLAYEHSENPLTVALSVPLWNCTCEYETTLNYYLGLTHSIAFSYCFR